MRVDYAPVLYGEMIQKKNRLGNKAEAFLLLIHAKNLIVDHDGVKRCANPSVHSNIKECQGF